MLCMFDVHHFPRLHLNVNQFTFSCSPGISGMRYTWLMYSFDLRCVSVTYIYIYIYIIKFDLILGVAPISNLIIGP